MKERGDTSRKGEVRLVQDEETGGEVDGISAAGAFERNVWLAGDLALDAGDTTDAAEAGETDPRVGDRACSIGAHRGVAGQSPAGHRAGNRRRIVVPDLHGLAG